MIPALLVAVLLCAFAARAEAYPTGCTTDGQTIVTTGGVWACVTPAAGGVPQGLIALFNGACPSGWSEVTAARGRMLVGTPSGGTDAGTVGTAFTNTQDKSVTPTFAGSALATHDHTYTEIVNHTHPVTDPGHTHLTQRYPTATGTSSGFTIDTSMSGTLADNTLPTKTATTGITTANPVGGVATGTTAAVSGGTPAGTVTAIATSSVAAYIQFRVCSKD